MKGRMYSRGEKKLEKNGKDRKETDIVKNEDLTPFFAPFGSELRAELLRGEHSRVDLQRRHRAF
jgi:hypothetical protein